MGLLHKHQSDSCRGGGSLASLGGGYHGVSLGLGISAMQQRMEFREEEVQASGVDELQDFRALLRMRMSVVEDANPLSFESEEQVESHPTSLLANDSRHASRDDSESESLSESHVSDETVSSCIVPHQALIGSLASSVVCKGVIHYDSISLLQRGLFAAFQRSTSSSSASSIVGQVVSNYNLINIPVQVWFASSPSSTARQFHFSTHLPTSPRRHVPAITCSASPTTYQDVIQYSSTKLPSQKEFAILHVSTFTSCATFVVVTAWPWRFLVGQATMIFFLARRKKPPDKSYAMVWPKSIASVAMFPAATPVFNVDPD
ncbi:hypothetical protein MPSEU_000312100 [Mayamaea pseudoterrestris]|nr:hypothetical protein MPSEU_000312100 [Mayamaea pseudoterrestris]